VFLKQLNTFVHNLGIGFLSTVNFLDYQYLLYGLALVGMMLVRPEGLFPSGRRRRELHVEPDEPGADEMGGDPTTQPMETV